MDVPRTVGGWIFRVLALIGCALVSAVLIYLALSFVGDFISPDSGDGFGNAGLLIMAVLTLVFAAPFIALILAMGLPLVSRNPKFRGAGR